MKELSKQVFKALCLDQRFTSGTDDHFVYTINNNGRCKGTIHRELRDLAKISYDRDRYIGNYLYEWHSYNLITSIMIHEETTDITVCRYAYAHICTPEMYQMIERNKAWNEIIDKSEDD